jgi:uncharacterized membrane protein
MKRLAIRRHLLAGLLILLPVWLTALAVRWAFETLSAVSEPVVRPALTYLSDLTGLSLGWLVVVTGALLTLLVIYFVGFLGERVLGARLHRGLDRLVARVPLVGTVYGGVRKLLAALQGTPDKAQRVVFVRSARGGTSVGFVTRTLVDAATGQEYAAVFVPTTPNPTSGSLELVPVEDVRPSDITVDEAMSFILSGGAVAPERFDQRVDG